mgnify:FL=1|tara:strand:- start:360 stop:488 length:129 start_codon:yes stop_codon:yes gene_type:complete
MYQKNEAVLFKTFENIQEKYDMKLKIIKKKILLHENASKKLK